MQLEIKHLLIILLVVAIIFFPVGLAHGINAFFHGLGVMLQAWFH
jgi:hypothetical protein